MRENKKMEMLTRFKKASEGSKMQKAIQLKGKRFSCGELDRGLLERGKFFASKTTYFAFRCISCQITEDFFPSSFREIQKWQY
jgi:hypothetical protein